MRIGAGGDSARFKIADGDLLNMTSADLGNETSYMVNITACRDGSVFSRTATTGGCMTSR